MLTPNASSFDGGVHYVRVEEFQGYMYPIEPTGNEATQAHFSNTHMAPFVVVPL